MCVLGRGERAGAPRLKPSFIHQKGLVFPFQDKMPFFLQWTLELQGTSRAQGILWKELSPGGDRPAALLHARWPGPLSDPSLLQDPLHWSQGQGTRKAEGEASPSRSTSLWALPIFSPNHTLCQASRPAQDPSLPVGMYSRGVTQVFL